ncbi:MAG: hypothetical protein EG822_18480 [Deltaproteobacteria bacterium]|nr:hypothetical protein [Deltaproteobacteria bacterium]TLN02856.1 MAG: replication initiation factor domain-containing protein [bacterium]
MFRLSALPVGLPDYVGFHYVAFNLPFACDNPAEVSRQMKHFTGTRGWIAENNRGFGGRSAYDEYYTLRNELGDVLVTLCTRGKGKAKNLSKMTFNGKCFEKTSHNCVLDVDGNPVNFLELATKVYEAGGSFTGLDIFKDDFRGVLPFKQIVEMSRKEHYRDRVITPLNKDRGDRINPPTYMSKDSDSLYFGDKNKNQVLFYDKGTFEMSKWSWIRVELKIRHKEDSNTIAQMLLEGANLDALASGILRNYLNFKVAGTKRKEKRETCNFWDQFVGTERIRLPRRKRTKKDDEIDFDDVSFD